MAPVIRYLSADNHTAATPTVKLASTGPSSPYFRVRFEVWFIMVCMWLSVYLLSGATDKYC